MSKKKKITVLILPLILLAAVFSIKFWAQEECVEYTGIFTENFDTVDYKDETHSAVANWPSGPITLNWLGGNLAVTSPTGMGGNIFVCDYGDFDNDGYPDLLGYEIDYDGLGNNRLVLVRNYFEDTDLDGVDDDGVIFAIDTNEVYEDLMPGIVSSISVADYNNDGLLDFFFIKNGNDGHTRENYIVALYINVGTATDPDFNVHSASPNLDFTSTFTSMGIYGYRWSAKHSDPIDIDGDGDTDVLVVDDNKIYIVRNPGPDNFALENFVISEISYDQQPGFPWDYAEQYGGSTVEAGDIDNDGDIDIVSCTVEDVAYLVFYENDGTGNFTRREIPIPDPAWTGPTTTHVADFNHDGLLDIFCTLDKWQSGNDAVLWLVQNKGAVEGEGLPFDYEFKCLNNCDVVTPSGDTDFGTVLDYDQDGDMDIVIADANDSGDYYVVRNDLADVFATYGEAWSLNLTPTLDPTQDAITKVRITDIQQSTYGGDPTGLRVEYYVTNNGRDWELYATFEGSDIVDQTDLPEHTFVHFGSQLKWKALFFAEEDEMPEFTGASYDTPQVHSIQFEYTTVERKEYSRTSVATTITIEGEQEKKLVIGDTFYFPGFEGHLRAYDVTSMTLTDSSYSELRTVTRSDMGAASGREIIPEGVTILWDAGELLDSRAASDRTIYTATPVDSDLTRIEFTVANVATLGPLLQDFNNDNEGLIDFVRGEGRDWKLGDSNHSNPIVVGPPDGDPNLKGAGYDTFKTTWEDRSKVLFVGANDGMLHCFDAVTGEEKWSFIPYNLLPKLRDMWAVDAVTGSRYYIREEYVDGGPVAEDVYIDADGDSMKEWITILICGQGPGEGSVMAGGTNYYFALDVTDPDDPQPLWEFTDSRLGETWSVPEIGKITVSGEDTWVAFAGSGYGDAADVGNVFYVVNLETGDDFWSFEASDIDTSASFTNIPNAFPGSPSIIDIDQDGYTDRVYIGDLDGRVWKVDVSEDYVDASSWTEELLYTDSNNYPIISNTAVWLSPSMTTPVPRLYFGTGGDDDAPDDTTYSFVAILDGDTPEVEWFIGDSAILGLDAAKDVGDLDEGNKVWADPKVSDNIVYFSTFAGSIESVDPCENIAGTGKLYARYIQPVAGTVIGGTAFRTPTGPTESLGLTIKTRAAVTMGERERTEGGTRKREVYVQEYDSTIQRLEQTVGALLKIKSWREIYKIIK